MCKKCIFGFLFAVSLAVVSVGSSQSMAAQALAPAPAQAPAPANLLPALLQALQEQPEDVHIGILARALEILDAQNGN